MFDSCSRLFLEFLPLHFGGGVWSATDSAWLAGLLDGRKRLWDGELRQKSGSDFFVVKSVIGNNVDDVHFLHL